MTEYKSDEEMLTKMFSDAKKEGKGKEVLARTLVDVQVKTIEKYAVPISKELLNIYNEAKEEIDEEFSKIFVSTLATTIGINIILNTPCFDEKQFRTALDDMIAQRKK